MSEQLAQLEKKGGNNGLIEHFHIDTPYSAQSVSLSFGLFQKNTNTLNFSFTATKKCKVLVSGQVAATGGTTSSIGATGEYSVLDTIDSSVNRQMKWYELGVGAVVTFTGTHANNLTFYDALVTGFSV